MSFKRKRKKYTKLCFTKKCISMNFLKRKTFFYSTMKMSIFTKAMPTFISKNV